VDGTEKLLDACIYNFDIRSTSVFSFTPGPLRPRKEPPMPTGKEAWRILEPDDIKKKQYVTVARIEPPFAGRPDHCLVIL
jgi:hypothetical protein